MVESGAYRQQDGLHGGSHNAAPSSVGFDNGSWLEQHKRPNRANLTNGGPTTYAGYDASVIGQSLVRAASPSHASAISRPGEAGSVHGLGEASGSNWNQYPAVHGSQAHASKTTARSAGRFAKASGPRFPKDQPPAPRPEPARPTARVEESDDSSDDDDSGPEYYL